MNYLSPDQFLTNDEVICPTESSCPADLLILNQPISHFDVFARLWMHTSYRICADGGANRLHDMFEGDLLSQRDHYVSFTGESDYQKTES